MGVFLRYPLHVLKGKKCEPLFLTGNLTPVALASALIVSRYSEGVVYLQGARDQRVWCGRPRERKHVACEGLAPMFAWQHASVSTTQGIQKAAPPCAQPTTSAGCVGSAVTYWACTPHSGCALIVSMIQSVDRYTSSAFWYLQQHRFQGAMARWVSWLKSPAGGGGRGVGMGRVPFPLS